MKPIPTDAKSPELARDRHDLGGPGHRAVKASVEAGDLRHSGNGTAKCLDEVDFAGQVFRVEWADSPELIEHLRGHSHRLGEVDSTVDDPVPDGRDRGEA